MSYYDELSSQPPRASFTRADTHQGVSGNRSGPVSQSPSQEVTPTQHVFKPTEHHTSSSPHQTQPAITQSPPVNSPPPKSAATVKMESSENNDSAVIRNPEIPAINPGKTPAINPEESPAINPEESSVNNSEETPSVFIFSEFPIIDEISPDEQIKQPGTDKQPKPAV